MNTQRDGRRQRGNPRTSARQDAKQTIEDGVDQAEKILAYLNTEDFYEDPVPGILALQTVDPVYLRVRTDFP